jgi:hypothetical protein
MGCAAAFEHVLVASVVVLAVAADLDLAAVPGRVGVDDERTAVTADVEYDVLWVRAVGVALVGVAVAVVGTFVLVQGIGLGGAGEPQLDGVS